VKKTFLITRFVGQGKCRDVPASHPVLGQDLLMASPVKCSANNVRTVPDVENSFN